MDPGARGIGIAAHQSPTTLLTMSSDIVPVKLLATAATVSAALWWWRRRAVAGSHSSRITTETVARYPGRETLGRAAVRNVTFAGPDVLLYLKSDATLTQRLYRHDLKSGAVAQVLGGDHVQEDMISAEEKARRERLRMLSTGITTYGRAVDAPDMILVPVGNEIFVSHGPEQPPVRLFDAASLPGAIVDPKLSDDGRIVAFCCADEVYVCSTSKDARFPSPVQVTSGARGTARTNGQANYIAQEELDRLDG